MKHKKSLYKKKGEKPKRGAAEKKRNPPSDQTLSAELFKAVAVKNPQTVKAVLEKGADPNCRDENRRTPLHRASSLDIIRLLVAAGADVNAQDQDGNVPIFLMLHPWFEDQTGAKYLIRAGADVNVRNNKGESIVDLIRQPVASALENNIANSHIELLKRHGFKE